MCDGELRELANTMKDCMTKEDSYRLTWNMSQEILKAVLDPVKNRCGQKATFENPKLDTEIQLLQNYYDWQISKANQNFRDHLEELTHPDKDE
jgi:hypothetical protein